MPKDENDPIKSIKADILYNPSNKMYCKIPLYVKNLEDVVFDNILENLL